MALLEGAGASREKANSLQARPAWGERGRPSPLRRPWPRRQGGTSLQASRKPFPAPGAFGKNLLGNAQAQQQQSRRLLLIPRRVGNLGCVKASWILGWFFFFDPNASTF